MENLRDLILKTAASRSTQCAVESSYDCMTYSELAEFACRAAGRLERLHVGKGDFLTIELPRSAKYVGIMLAAWMRGAVFAALDAAYPKDRLDYIAMDCHAKVRVNMEFLEGLEAEDPAGEAADLTPSDLAPSDPALLIYTSGSTGRPKGVLLSHQSILDSCMRGMEALRAGEHAGEHFGCSAPFSFVVGIQVVLAALTAGVTVCIVPYDVVRDPARFAGFIEEKGINIAFMPPKHLNVFRPQGNCLHTVITGSEKVSNVYRTDFRVVVSYGSSESAGGVLFFDIDRAYENTPIGQPVCINGRYQESAYILDEEGQLSEEGELCLSGNFALGYLNQPEETAKILVVNPFMEKDGNAVLLRTGDIVRRLPDGNILYLNRKDWMVKISGQRVEPGEIEQALRTVPGVHDAAVRDFENPAGQTYLCAFYVQNPEMEVTEEDLRGAVRSRLPEYMMPAFFVRLEALPLNANGKLDRSALKAPDASSWSAEYIAPRNETETQLCDAFAAVLDVPRAGIDDDFFRLGGDSIRVMMLQNECPGLKLSTRMIYDCRTPRELADELSKAEPEAETLLPGEIPTQAIPLTQTQLGICLESEKREGEAAYNNPMLFRLPADTDAVRLSEAVSTAFKAHPALFVRIVRGEDGMPAMQYEPTFLEQEICEIVSLTEEELARQKNTLVQPFLLRKDRLFRCRLYRTEEALHLFMDFHHIIFDGTSMHILFADIEKAFRGETVTLEEYTAFHAALDEQRERGTDAYQKAAQWYRKTFEDFEEVSLPSGDKTEDETCFAALQYPLSVDAETLHRFCEKNNSTENVVTTAAFGYLLSAYTMNKNAAFATYYNGRQDLRADHTVSMFVKTLPVFCRIRDGLSVKDYLQELKQQILGTMANDIYSFADVASQIGMSSDVLFTYQGDMFDVPQLDGIRTERETLPFNATGEPLSVQLLPHDGTLTLDIQYHGNRYSEDYIRQFARCYDQVLSRMLTQDCLTDIPLLDAEKEREILALSKGEDMSYEGDTWVDLFLAQARKHPDKTAVIDSVSSMTYGELDRQSDSVAAFLMEKGVGKNSFVPVKMGRVKEFIVAALGIHKAGACYVPVDLEYPAERIQYILEDSEAKLILTEELVQEAITQYGDAPAVNLADKDCMIYMIYTSGSTGKPKGAINSQGGFRAFVEWINKEFGHGEDTMNLVHSSFSFDGSTIDSFCALAAGATTHILPEELRKDPDGIAAYIREHHITHTFMTTQVGSTLINYYDLPLRCMSVGGEKLLPTRKAPYKVYNIYGPTECAPFITLYEVQGNETDVPIGRPVQNSYAFICDPRGHLLPQGIPGELCLGGVQVGLGYWKRPELTAEKFCACPFLPGEKMYKTGDLARYDENGLIQYIGRIDFQVKLRGYRIELGEIENKASQYPGMHMVAAEVKKDQLVLYYTSENPIDEEALRSLLAKSLAEYMVPTVYVRLENMPMTPSGKISRKQLPEPESAPSSELVAPETETEKKLAGFVQELLKRDGIGVTENLVSLGLSSLSAMGLSAKISSAMGRHIRVADIMKYPTIRELAANIDAGEESGEGGLHAYEKRELYPLTENQRGVFIDWEMNRATTQYNIPLVVEFENVDGETLRDAAEKTVEAHPCLKTGFVYADGDLMQKQNAGGPATIQVHALEQEPDTAFFQNLVRPFNLLEEPLYRIAVYTWEAMTPSSTGEGNRNHSQDGVNPLLRASGGCQSRAGEDAGKPAQIRHAQDLNCGKKTWLFMDIHHIIFDGMSIDVFLGDLRKALAGERIEPETVTAWDLALYEQELKDGEAWNEAQKRFDALASEAEAVSLPAAGKPDNVPESKLADTEIQGNKVYVTVSGNEIDRFCTDCGVTPGSFLQAAFAETVHRLTREEKGMYTTVSNGRSAGAQLNGCVGMFVRTLPVFTVDSAALTSREYVRAVHAQLQETYAVEFYPYTRFVERHGLRAEMMFVYQVGLWGDTEGCKVTNLSQDTTKLPITVTALPEGDDYLLEVEYDTARYGKEEMLRFAGAVKNCAEGLTREEHVKDIRLVSEEEEKEILALSKGEDLAYEKEETWIDLFRSWVQKTPDHTAVVDSKGSYTYRQLDQASDSIAAALLDLGVKENSFVAVRMGRTKEFIAAVIGVQKAGAAYVPVDPDYPADRIAYILEDSESPTELTDQTVADLLQKYAGAAPVNHATPGHLAYMIYTSGSTGRPKGVMISQRALRAYVAWSTRDFGYETEGRYAHSVSFSFDASVTDIVCPLSVGAQTHVLSYEVRQNIGMLYDYLEHFRIMGVKFPTQLGMLMLNTYPDLPIRFTVLGGEKLLPVARTDVTMFNEYGPTEFTIGSTVHVVNQDTDDDIPIGRAVPNSWSVVCDRHGQLVPRGMTGELCLIGDQIAEGYWKRPELTKEKFCDCPFLPGRKMYRTGDLARYNEAGVAECLGRIDTQVKIRGFRVELGEIEARASQFDGILHVAAEVKQDQLVLYYTSVKPVKEEELRAFLAHSLADFMVPTVYMRLETMPMTPAGKISRKDLPEPETDLQLKKEPPRNVQEALLLEIAQKIFGRDDFGVTDSFSLLGLNSLQAMRIVAEAESRRIRIKVNDLMKHDTIRKLVDAHMTVCYQEGTYDPALPTVVMVCGITSYRNLGPLSDALREKVNLFVVEPIKSHYHMIFKGEKMEDVISFYGTFLDYILDGRKVDAFLGHCYGGELAFRLAAWWQKEHPGYLNIFLLDSPWNEKEDQATSAFFDMLPSTLAEGQLKWEKVEHTMITDLIQPGRPHVNGRVVFFEAGQEEERNVRALEVLPEAQRAIIENMKQTQDQERGMTVPEIYRAMSDDFEYVRVEGSHVGMLSPQFVPVYADSVMRCLKK